MSNTITVVMTEQDERDLKRKQLMEYIRSRIKVVDKLPFEIADDDPVLLRKEQECIKSFYETPWPEEVLKRMGKID